MQWRQGIIGSICAALAVTGAGFIASARPRLRELRNGDQILILSANLVCTVTQMTHVTITPFPTRAAYGPALGPQLRLVTCGGLFDPARTHSRTT